MDPRLEVAIAAAKAAGTVAMGYFRTALTVEDKGHHSPVTRADRECAQRIGGTAIASNRAVHDEILRLIGPAPVAA